MPRLSGPDRGRFDPRRVAAEGPARRSRIYVVGEAPGEAEAEVGRPFVGPAGQTLRRMMRAAGIDPGPVRLGNAIPYRPIAPIWRAVVHELASVRRAGGPSAEADRQKDEAHLPWHPRQHRGAHADPSPA